MARQRVRRRSPQERVHSVHLASGAAALDWPRLKDGRHMRMPKAVFLNELQEWKRDCGAPRKRYKDQLKGQLAQAKISHLSWQQEASDRDSWHSSVRKASRKFEAERHVAAKERRRRQKERAASQSSSTQTFVCPKCGRGCVSRIGLYSHRGACKKWPATFPKSSSARNQPLSSSSHSPSWHGAKISTDQVTSLVVFCGFVGGGRWEEWRGAGGLFLCFVLSCFVLSCFVLFCLFCLVLSCFVLFCLVLFCFMCRTLLLKPTDSQYLTFFRCNCIVTEKISCI